VRRRCCSQLQADFTDWLDAEHGQRTGTSV
jgi:hypothetical protein